MPDSKTARETRTLKAEIDTHKEIDDDQSTVGGLARQGVAISDPGKERTATNAGGLIPEKRVITRCEAPMQLDVL